MFVICAILWFSARILFVIILFSVVNKFHECTRALVSGPLDTYSPVSSKYAASVCCCFRVGLMVATIRFQFQVLPQLKKIMAARGLRYFGMMASQVMQINITGTIFIVLLCWTTRNAYNHALTCLVFSLLFLLYDLFSELSCSLGGTCLGYSVVVPVASNRCLINNMFDNWCRKRASFRSDGFVNLLPSGAAQELNLRSTACLQATARFFDQHVIQNFGCDLSSSGLDWSDLRRKLLEFFAQRTAEGPHFDTYLLHFSGPTNDKGDWVMKGGLFSGRKSVVDFTICNIRQHNSVV